MAMLQSTISSSLVECLLCLIHDKDEATKQKQALCGGAAHRNGRLSEGGEFYGRTKIHLSRSPVIHTIISLLYAYN